MARMPRDHRLETIDARRKLAARIEPYWRQVVPGTFLGYRRNAKTGVWVARHRQGDGYHEARLATADDYVPADGEVVLTYAQGVSRVQRLGLARHMTPPRHYGDGCTIGTALDAYFDQRRGTNPQSSSTAGDEHQANRHIRPRFGERLINTLTASELQSWLTNLANSQPTVRAKGALARRALGVDLTDPVVQHRRRQTANRVWNIFRAALNHAWPCKVPLCRSRDRLPTSIGAPVASKEEASRLLSWSRDLVAAEAGLFARHRVRPLAQDLGVPRKCRTQLRRRPQIVPRTVSYLSRSVGALLFLALEGWLGRQSCLGQ
jgi:hypothetical protein